jgi:ABC-type phosphate/phosphonate transport system substrate-binding protein
VYVARKDVPKAEQQKFARALLGMKEGTDDPALKILRAKQFVVASDQEYATERQIAKELNPLKRYSTVNERQVYHP